MPASHSGWLRVVSTYGGGSSPARSSLPVAKDIAGGGLRSPHTTLRPPVPFCERLATATRTVARVEALVRKVRLKADADTQTLEDVICLVFLEHYLPAFATQHDDAKLVDILRKTWRKMSERGRSAALQLDLAPGDPDPGREGDWVTGDRTHQAVSRVVSRSDGPGRCR